MELLLMIEAKDVEGFQALLMNDLGVYLRGYAPKEAVGRGGVVYRDIDTQCRLALAGFQGPELKRFITGEVSFTTRTMFRLIQAAHGTDRGTGSSVVRLKTEVV